MKKTSKRRSREPSEKSLREMPEANFTGVKVRRNPYARRIAQQGITVNVGKGRPRKGTEVGKTIPKSIRFPEEAWKMLARRAEREGISLHAALRAAIVEWAKRAA